MFCMVLLLVLSKVHRGLKELIGYQFKYVLKCKKEIRIYHGELRRISFVTIICYSKHNPEKTKIIAVHRRRDFDRKNSNTDDHLDVCITFPPSFLL